MNLYGNQDNPEEVTHMTMEQYQEYKASCEEVIRQAKVAVKLAENPEFKEIVMGAYFEHEPKRLAGLMASGRLTEKQFDDCAGDLRSIGSMRGFLQAYIQKGEIAQGELDNLEIAWNEAIAAENSTGEETH